MALGEETAIRQETLWVNSILRVYLHNMAVQCQKFFNYLIIWCMRACAIVLFHNIGYSGNPDPYSQTQKVGL